MFIGRESRNGDRSLLRTLPRDSVSLCHRDRHPWATEILPCTNSQTTGAPPFTTAAKKSQEWCPTVPSIVLCMGVRDMIRRDAEVGGAWPRWFCMNGLLGGCGDLAQELREKSKSFKELGYSQGPAAAAVSNFPERAGGQRDPAHSPPVDKQHPAC